MPGGLGELMVAMKSQSDAGVSEHQRISVTNTLHNKYTGISLGKETHQLIEFPRTSQVSGRHVLVKSHIKLLSFIVLTHIVQ